MARREFTLLPERPERLDKLLAAAWPDLSRSRLQALIREGHVSLDRVVVIEPSIRIGSAASVRLDEPPPIEAAPGAEAIPLAVMYEDDQLVVLDKPAGLVVHPGAGNADGTLVNALLAHCGGGLSGIGGVRRPGIVHRLDKDTSGLLVVAKTDAAHRHLSAQFADHGRTGVLARAYLALAWGAPEPRRGRVDLPLDRHPTRRDRMAIARDGHGRHAVTRYAVEESFAPRAGEAPVASLVRCELETGRTHQIRVHLAHLGHPLIGDPVYGAGFRTRVSRLGDPARGLAAALPRQALHATTLRFAHPRDGTVLSFESPLPGDLAALHAALKAP